MRMRPYFTRLEPDTFFQRRLSQLSGHFAAIVFTVGLLVLMGWEWDIYLLKRPIPHLTAMNPLTALSFVLASLSLLFLSPSKSIPLIKKMASVKRGVTGNIFAVLVLLAGVLRILGAAHILHFPIDQLLFSSKLLSDQGKNLSNQMTVNTACCFILTGITLLFLNTKTSGGWMAANFTALLIGILGLFSIVGYLYRVQAFYGVFQYTPMAIHTASCFLLLSLSLLFVNPGMGMMQEFTSVYSGSMTARRLMPLIILLPIFLGYLRLWGYWQAAFSTEFGVTILVLSIILVLIGLIWYNTYLLNKRDFLKKQSDLTLQESEERYRILVSSVKDYAIFMLDPSGTIISWNEGARQIKGYMAEEIIGKHMSVFYTDEDIKRGEPAHNLDMARSLGRFENEGWRVRKDGSAFWVNIVFTALYAPNGKLLGFAKVTRDITEKKTSEDQIAYMARLMEDTSDAIFSTDSFFIIRTWNKAAELLFGYNFEEVKGRLATEILRSKMRQKERKLIQQELLEVGYWKGETHYLKKDDSVLTIALSVSRVRNADGIIDGFVMVCRDFTERKKLEWQLQQFNKDLEDQVKKKTAELTGIFERITDAFIAVDKDFHYTYLNKKAGELIHRDPASLIGRLVWDVFPDAVGSPTYLAFNKAMKEQKNIVNTDYYPPLNLWQENHLYPSPDGLSVFIRDITEQKKREREITDYKLALDQSSIVSITDQDGVIKRVNENFCKNSKFTEEELIGQDHRIINSGYHSKEFMQDLRDTIAEGKIWKGEVCNKAKDGTMYWVDTTIFPFLNEKSEPFEYIAIRTDITERKKKELELHSAHELLQRSYEEIRQLASHLQDVREEERAGIAREIHDELGQQLTGIKMDLSWIAMAIVKEESELQEKVSGTLDLLNTTIKTVRRIATDLRPSILDDLGLIAALEWQGMEFEKRSGIHTEFISAIQEFNSSPAIAIGIFRICQESLTNIARHAEARNVILILEENKDRSLLLKIEDDGKGFEPGKVGSKKTLGLLGMKERTLMMGGSFEISSKPGKGTHLRVTIPSVDQ